MRYVIIGAGPAGVVAAEYLAENDPKGDVLIISGEPEPPYSRMAIPYLLSGKIDEPGTYLRKTTGHFEAKGIGYRQARVTAVDASARSIALEGGESLAYDKLLVASGSRPVRPPIPGMDLDGVLSCWTLADARAIAAKTQPGTRVVLMGAGFIGCIILEALVSRGVELTVVEMEQRMVPRMMTAAASSMLKRWCEAKGISVMTGTQVNSVAATEAAGLTVALADGGSLTVDSVICATGVTANVEFLKGSGVEIDRGIVVDASLRSSDEHIYAAGDVAQAMDFSSGECMVQAIQPTAVEHGRLAALNMVGRSARHEGCLNMNVLDTLGLVSSSFGSWMGVEGGEQGELSNPRRFEYLNLQFDGDVLVGASSLGLTQHLGVLRGLIQSRMPLGEWKDVLVKEPNRIMEAYIACSRVLAA